MNIRRFFLFTLWALVAAVSLLTLENIYANSRTAKSSPMHVLYLAGTHTPPEAIPSDRKEVILWQGIKPRSLGDRDAGLIYRLSSVPKSWAPFLTLITKNISDWEAKGVRVKSVCLDYAVDDPDWPLLLHMLGELKSKTQGKYEIRLAAHPAWFLNKKNEPFIEDMQNAVGFLVFDLDDAVSANQTPAEFVAELEKVRFPFYLIVDRSTDTAAFHKNHTAAAQFLAGFIIALGNGHDDQNRG